jgi:hypothetical protein
MNPLIRLNIGLERTRIAPTDGMLLPSHMRYDATTQVMFRQMIAPRRNVRGPFLGTAKDDAAWADTLDWQSNDYDFHRLLQRLCDRLDLHYREEFGLRLDQLADRQEIAAAARRAASWYRQAGQEYRVVCIHEYLYRDLNRLLSKRAREVFGKRQKLAKELLEARNKVQPVPRR